MADIDKSARRWTPDDIIAGSGMCDRGRNYIFAEDHDRIVTALQSQVDALTVNNKALIKHGDTLRTQLAQAQNEALERAALKCDEAEESDPGFNGRGNKLGRIIRGMKSK